MNIPAKADYAIRALLALSDSSDGPTAGSALAEAQHLPAKFLEEILSNLRRGGLVTSQRGAQGGYLLARPANTIAIADVIRTIDGPLADVRGIRPEAIAYEGATAHLQVVWIAVRASLRSILERTTLADVASGNLPRHVRQLLTDPEAWQPH